MGAQGCWKGTQAKLLANDLDLVHISAVAPRIPK
jgi:adenylate kinase family enzyme